jgi:hypothetical protein
VEDYVGSGGRPRACRSCPTASSAPMPMTCAETRLRRASNATSGAPSRSAVGEPHTPGQRQRVPLLRPLRERVCHRCIQRCTTTVPDALATGRWWITCGWPGRRGRVS